MESTEAVVEEIHTEDIAEKDKPRTKERKETLKNAYTGLMIYTPESTEWPKEPLTRSRLVR